MPNLENASYGSRASARSQKTDVPCAYRAVLRAIGDHADARALVLSEFRARRGTPDRWHQRPTRVAMLGALGCAEDALEVEHRGRATPARAALRVIRRRLELELWS
jgi:hypothetical protein